MKIRILITSLFLTTTSFVCMPPSKEKEEIHRLLLSQVSSWNQGDIDGFMEGYENSDSLRFASGGDVVYGWQTMKERYKTRYTTRELMGTLAFTDIAVTLLSGDRAMAFGKWTLFRAQDQPSGLFTLILRKTTAGWKIFHDHTSLLETK